MEIVKRVEMTATHKGITLTFMFVKCSNGKWYELKKNMYGCFLKEVTINENIKVLEKCK